MMLSVEMFGLSPHTELNKAEVEVKNGAGLPELLLDLGRVIPALQGTVIERGNGRLAETYGLYLNGQFVSHDDHIKLKEGDHIVLILLAVGG
jgi:hypothetical protein